MPPETLEIAHPPPLRQAAIYSAMHTATPQRAAFGALAARTRFIARLGAPLDVLLPAQIMQACEASAHCSPVHCTALLRTWLDIVSCTPYGRQFSELRSR